jgi:hypothetical protein
MSEVCLKANQGMELFEKVHSVAHYNYQDSNGGPLNFVKI